MISIPLSQWLKWTEQERADIMTHYEGLGRKWYIDALPIGNEFEKDRKEYNEDMSIGGRPFKP